MRVCSRVDEQLFSTTTINAIRISTTTSTSCAWDKATPSANASMMRIVVSSSIPCLMQAGAHAASKADIAINLSSASSTRTAFPSRSSLTALAAIILLATTSISAYPTPHSLRLPLAHDILHKMSSDPST
jgi:hypothetical protein